MRSFHLLKQRGTYGRTYGPIDGRTDTTSYKDATAYLKTQHEHLSNHSLAYSHLKKPKHVLLSSVDAKWFLDAEFAASEFQRKCHRKNRFFGVF